MPESDRPDEAPSPGAGDGSAPGGELPESTPREELRVLEETVDRLLDVLGSLRSRAAEAEADHRQLRDALSRVTGEGDDLESLEDRLRALSEENERLRGILEEGREKADRIRSRLVLLEDEREA